MVDVRQALPEDGLAGTLVGRAHVPGEGPSVVLLGEDGVFDLSRSFATMTDVINSPGAPAVRAALASATRIGSVEELLENTGTTEVPGSGDMPHFLCPVDLQAVKAAGVTFAESMLERVIEEKAKGDPAAAEGIRRTISGDIGVDLATLVPGSDDAERLKATLQAQGMWSQYLEVGIGPYAEVFTKTQPMASVGLGAEIGLHPESSWNNPEPEVVLVIDSTGKIVGATLGNDVNLRDFEGRSALLLSKAKDNNASSAIGPFIRLFDDTFTLDDVRAMDVALEIYGEDGFELKGGSSMSLISRDVEDLARQTLNANHQYPDALVLFTGTMFAPVTDRDAPGQGFTHHIGDVVHIATPKLGRLINRVTTSDRIAPWTFGASALMKNLAGRGLL
ncbi:fumarylacetoacetate hydrolase family protein [Breoghania sp. L-A4]|uniref:fumarylacetoacetate hydrolase family protein n=1 Tax=Breoghania sp. L-A4 TaxID=2304600 RepID=UPI000E35A799|nr:fumarylacetoacetate hydrolase family protein [Breoghania sp. L-A4]AXS42544.1 fumarylacetoacetate hydrolase [Breoghania sp. L-A4]